MENETQDKTQAAAALFEESRKVAEDFYYQYATGENVDEIIEAIAELIHYGNGDLALIRQRMALQSK